MSNSNHVSVHQKAIMKQDLTAFLAININDMTRQKLPVHGAVMNIQVWKFFYQHFIASNHIKYFYKKV